MEPKEKRKTSVRYAPEVRERAIRMVLEHARDHASRWEAIGSIAAKIGCTTETLRDWEQARRKPQGAAWAYLLVIAHEIEAVMRALKG